MNIGLWIVQILLAVVFGLAGFMKLTAPQARLAERMDWVKGLTITYVRLLGLAEILGALGLILPGATGILPILTPLAAVGLAVIMIGAARLHLRRGETPMAIGNLVLLALAIFVAYGRLAA